MADLSDAFSQAPAASTPFDGLGQEGQANPGSSLPQATVDRTARMSTLALAPAQELINNYQKLTQAYSNEISQSGDDGVRTQAATKQVQDQVSSYGRLAASIGSTDPTGRLQRGIQAAVDQTVNEDINTRKEYALEQQAYENIQNLAASGDYTQAKVLSQQLLHGDPEEVIKDVNIKKAIIAREVERSSSEVSDQGWFRSVVDFVAGTVGDFTLQGSLNNNGNVDIDKSMTHWFDWIVSGERQNAEAQGLWAKNPGEFAKALREQVIPRIDQHTSRFGYANHSAALNVLTDLQNAPDPWATNVRDLTNVAMGPLSLLPVSKAVSLPVMMVRAAARKEAANMIADTALIAIREGTTAAEKATGVTVDEVVDHTLPTAVNPVKATQTVPLTGDALDAFDRGKKLLDELPAIRQSGRMTQQEFSQAVVKEQEAIQKEIGRPLKNFDTQPVQLTDGSITYQHVMDIGKKKGGGFSSDAVAKDYAVANGWDDAEIVQDESGQSFVRIKKNMAENGFLTTQLNPGLAKTGLLGRFTLGARQAGDDILQMFDRASANARNKTIKILKDKYGPVIEAVNGPEKDLLANVIAKGNNESTWWSNDEIDELFSRQGATQPPSQKVFDAYQAHRDLNDIEFAMRNDVEWKRDATRGFSTVSLKNSALTVDRENALVNRSPKLRPTGRVYDASTGIHYNTKSNALTEDRFNQMVNDGYVTVALKKEKVIADGTTVKQILVKKSELAEETLRRDQMPYRAGGHRMYSDKYFAKQTDFGIQPDTGERFLKNPNTFITGTKAEVQRWTKVMETARQYVASAGLKKVDMGLLDGILGKLGHWDAEDFIKNIQDGKMNLKHPIEAMFDRELPTEYSHTKAALDFVDPEETGFTGWMRTQGRMYYSGRGEGLTDWQGELAKTVDPFETVNRAMTNIANLTSFSDYKLTAVERWVNTYRDFLDFPKDASDLTVFAEGKYRSTVDKQPMGAGLRIKQQMEAQRDIIRRNLGWQTELDRYANRYTQNLTDFIMGGDPTSLRHDLGRIVTNWWEAKNPLNALRGIAFDLKMGLFNVAQFPLQIQTMLATLALSPEHAPGAFANLLPMRTYLTKAGSEEMLNTLVSRGMHKQLGLAPEEYKVMMRMGKQSGFFEFGGTHQMMNYYGPNTATTQFAKGYDAVRSAGRWFFNEGETWNRVTAWQVAFKDVIGSHVFPAEASPAAIAQQFEEFGRKIALKADDYSMNMMEQSSSVWQQGVLSIPTQFWAYNARMLEALTGKQFSTAQKMRLLVAQTFFYGAAGAPVVGVVSDLYNKHEGKAAPMDSVAGWFERGTFDEIAYHFTGADVNIGKRYGGGTWMTDMVGELLGMSPYGEKSFADVVGGATYSIMKDTYGTLATAIKHVVAESGAQDYPLSKDDWIKFAEEASTFSYAQKAYVGLQYHAFISTKGTLVAKDLPTADAFYFALGIQPGEQNDVAAASGYLKDRKQAILNATKWYTSKINEMSVEPDRRDEIAAQVNAYSRTLPNDIRFEALRKSRRTMPDSIVHSLGLQMERDKAQREMMNKVNGQSN